MTNKEYFSEQIGNWNIKISDKNLKLLECYVAEILEKNSKFNLISNSDAGNIWTRHILDSLSPLQNMENIFPLKTTKPGGDKPSVANTLAGKLIIDAGSGAGFPGIPLKILLEDANFTLCEPNLKRRQFLTWVISKLKLKKISAKGERVGEAPDIRSGKADILIERAMGQLENILPQCLNMVKDEGGLFCAWHSSPEILKTEKIKAIIKRMNANTCNIHEYKLPPETKVRFILTLRRGKCI